MLQDSLVVQWESYNINVNKKEKQGEGKNTKLQPL